MISSNDNSNSPLTQPLQSPLYTKVTPPQDGDPAASPVRVTDPLTGGDPAPLDSSESLPCLYSNNSIGTSKSRSQLASENTAGLVDMLTAYGKKQAHTLYSNVERFVSKVAKTPNHVAFFTLTFPDKVYDHKEAAKRWNSLNTNYLKLHPELGHWLRVSEQHRDGSWHFHCLVALEEDIRTGFDFDVYGDWLESYRQTKRRKRLNTGSVYLRNLWQDLRSNLQNYGFGRSELVPIRSNAEAMGRYVGKYISKHVGQRKEDSKGVRLVSYSRGWSKNSMKMVFLTDNSKEWRRKVQLFAEYHGCTDLYQLTDKLGSRWAYNHIQEIYDIDTLLAESGGVTCGDYQEQTYRDATTNADQRQAARLKQLVTHIPTKKREEKSKEQYRIMCSLSDYTDKLIKLDVRYYYTTLPSEVPF